jgi:hypothetical protein
LLQRFIAAFAAYAAEFHGVFQMGKARHVAQLLGPLLDDDDGGVDGVDGDEGESTVAAGQVVAVLAARPVAVEPLATSLAHAVEAAQLGEEIRVR